MCSLTPSISSRFQMVVVLGVAVAVAYSFPNGAPLSRAQNLSVAVPSQRLEAPRPTPCPLQNLLDARGALPPAAGLRSLLRRKPSPSFSSPRSRRRVHLCCHVPSTCPARPSSLPPPAPILVPDPVCHRPRPTLKSLDS